MFIFDSYALNLYNEDIYPLAMYLFCHQIVLKQYTILKITLHSAPKVYTKQLFIYTVLVFITVVLKVMYECK